jgi:endonuclease YncB( thermonuclease family)
MSEAAEFTGKVLWVYDGDSFKMNVDGRGVVQVRLYGIDAPEKDQPGGRMALKAAIKLLKNKTVRVVKVDIDKYKRVVGKVYLGKLYVNLWLLNNGYAWRFKFFSLDKNFSQAERRARQAKLGIWQLTNNIPPWEYRQKNSK